MQDIQELRDERVHLLRSNKDIIEKAKTESGATRQLTEDEERLINENLAEADRIEEQIKTIQRQEELRSRVVEEMDELSRPQKRKSPMITPEQPKNQDPTPNIEFRRVGKLKAFRDEFAAYKSGQWIRANLMGDGRAAMWCRDHGVPVAGSRAMSEGVNADGGALVPVEFEQTIIDLREQYGVFRQEARVWPMGRDNMVVPRRAGGLTAYWASEGGTVTASDASFSNVELSAKKLMTYTKASVELSEDAVIDIAEWLAQESAYAFALKEDQTGFIGDGTSTYNGIKGIASILEGDNSLAGYVEVATATHDLFSEVDTDDIAKVMGKLPKYARMNAKFYCSQTCHDMVFQRLALEAGGNTIQTVTGEFRMAFLGYPIVISQVLEDSTSAINNSHMFLFGDLSMAATIGDRREFRFENSRDYLFANDQIAFKGTERIDINIHDYGDSSTAGPIVGLMGSTS